MAFCAIVGYAVVAGLLRKRDDLQKKSDYAPGEEKSENGEESIEQWYETLKVSPFASVEEIQVAFRCEIAKYHPDRVANLGFELRALPERRSKKITNAYALGLRIRGSARQRG